MFPNIVDPSKRKFGSVTRHKKSKLEPPTTTGLALESSLKFALDCVTSLMFVVALVTSLKFVVGFVTSSLHWCRSMKGSLDCFRWNVVSLLLSVAIFLPLTPPSFSKLKIKLVEIPKFQWNFCSPICLSPKRIDWTVCWPKIVYLFSTAMPTEIDETTSLVNLVCWHFWSTFRTVRPTIS